jgi:hypothetical protein
LGDIKPGINEQDENAKSSELSVSKPLIRRTRVQTPFAPSTIAKRIFFFKDALALTKESMKNLLGGIAKNT